MSMNLTETETQTDQSETPATTEQLRKKLEAMEKAGASVTDRMRVAIEFFQAKNKNPFAKTVPFDASVDDEDISCDDDLETSAHDANGCSHDPHTSAHDPHTSDQTSAPDPLASDHQAHEPSDPELPPPPKFQFGPGNPLYEIALDFRSHRDKRSILDHLSDDQRAAISKLLDGYNKYEVSELLAKRPPAGLGIHVTRYALTRFEKRYKKQKRARASLAFQHECDQLLEAAQTNDQAFLYASERLLKMRLFQITGDPEADLEEIAKLTDIITRIRKQSLAERKLNVAQKSTGDGEPNRVSAATQSNSTNTHAT
jgi:hypothetical protein